MLCKATFYTSSKMLIFLILFNRFLLIQPHLSSRSNTPTDRDQKRSSGRANKDVKCVVEPIVAQLQFRIRTTEEPAEVMEALEALLEPSLLCTCLLFFYSKQNNEKSGIFLSKNTRKSIIFPLENSKIGEFGVSFPFSSRFP